MNKRYQVFVSSTFTDLQQERAKVIDAIMRLRCIPVGMEHFTAADEEQFEFIKKIIDDCDYYVLIIGARYGSLATDGLSYTEKEYDYALKKGLKVLAFLPKNPGKIPADKCEIEAEKQVKLAKFKEKVRKNRLIDQYENPDDLVGKVNNALAMAIAKDPGIGWMRADQIANNEVLQDLNQRIKENEALKQQLQVYKDKEKENEVKLDDLAGLNEELTIGGTTEQGNWKVKLQWCIVFATIAPFLLCNPNDQDVEQIASLEFFKQNRIKQGTNSMPEIYSIVYQTIKLQLSALGLVKLITSETTKDNTLYWQLTDKGKNLMYELRCIKSEA